MLPGDVVVGGHLAECFQLLYMCEASVDCALAIMYCASHLQPGLLCELEAHPVHTHACWPDIALGAAGSCLGVSTHVSARGFGGVGVGRRVPNWATSYDCKQSITAPCIHAYSSPVSLMLRRP